MKMTGLSLCAEYQTGQTKMEKVGTAYLIISDNELETKKPPNVDQTLGGFFGEATQLTFVPGGTNHQERS